MGWLLNNARALALGCLATLVAACTTTTITPQYANPPERKYDMAAVGEVTATDKLWDGLIPYFRRGFRDQLSKDNSVASVSEDPPAAPVGASMLVVVGTITEIDRGNAAARFIIGLGAGRAIARGMFEIRDGDGTVLAKFESRKAYSGGAGIGGADMVSMEELVQQLGAETANVVARWMKGQRLDATSSPQ
ncbi:MAG TPA: DUF4410 domain-containing protein [Stellaceae bacterium]|nr:DUF4410 domain-containing protein [Stellaceae bacterium]